jgi:hypothetical protein
MVDDLAGDTAEDKLFTSRKTLPSNYDGIIFGLVSFCQDALRHRWAVADRGTD